MYSNTIKPCLLAMIFFPTDIASAQSILSATNRNVPNELNVELKFANSDRGGMRLLILKSSGLIRKPKEYFSFYSLTRQQTGLILLDYHPNETSFRLSMGLAIKHHRWDINASPMVYYQSEDITVDIDTSRLPSNYTFTVDAQALANRVSVYANELGYDLAIDSSTIDEQYTVELFGPNDAEDSYQIELPTIQIDQEDFNVRANLLFNRIAPYFGIGWETRPYSKSNVQYSADIGLIYHGQPSTTFEWNGAVFEVNESLSQYLYRLAYEEETELNHDLRHYRFMPYLSFAMQIRF